MVVTVHLLRVVVLIAEPLKIVNFGLFHCELFCGLLHLCLISVVRIFNYAKCAETQSTCCILNLEWPKVKWLTLCKELTHTAVLHELDVHFYFYWQMQTNGTSTHIKMTHERPEKVKPKHLSLTLVECCSIGHKHILSDNDWQWLTGLTALTGFNCFFFNFGATVPGVTRAWKLTEMWQEKLIYCRQ